MKGNITSNLRCEDMIYDIIWSLAELRESFTFVKNSVSLIKKRVFATLWTILKYVTHLYQYIWYLTWLVDVQKNP